MRRVIRFLAAMVSIGLLGALGTGGGFIRGSQVADAQTVSRPNIVFILTDDQAESTLSHMPNVQTLLQAQGRTFTNAFNVYPFCSPSRATIQRGQYAHNHGVFGNGPGDTRDHGGYPAFDALDREKSTVATWLHAAGYRTIHMGKYMNNFTSQDANPPGWDVFGTPTVPSQDGETKTATTANRAMAQLREDAPKIGPFFLQVSFQAPHVPNDYESQDAAKFVGEQVPRVASFDEQDVTDKPRYIRDDKPPLSQQTDPEVDARCQDTEVNSIEQNDCEYVGQLRNLQTVDRFTKDVTDYLATQGELSNTYVVYYSDNGNHWGEHRLDFGKQTPYETDTGFPLLIRGPGIPEGETSTKLIGNHDIAPTFAQIAGASTPSFVDGRSFLRLTDADPSNDSPWRTAIYSERQFLPDWPLPPKDNSGLYVPPWEAVREENLIYIRHRDDPWTSANDEGFVEVYDLSSDPDELRNLAHYGEVPQATLNRLQDRLVRLRGCQAEACRAAEDEPTTNTEPPPDAPPETSITSGPAENSRTTSTSVTFAFSSNEQDSTFNCQLNKDGAVAQAWTDCASPKSYSNLTPGNYRFDVQATDPAGNVDPTPASRNWIITSGDAAPTVISTTPTANATGVTRTANVTATFSEDMMASSINTPATTFKLFKKGSTTKLSATVSYQSSTDMATLDPTNSLQAGVTYKAVVTTGAKDLAGIPLDQNSTTSGNQQKVWTFTTGTR